MPAPELIRIFVRPIRRLGLPYMVTGSVASILYGEPRLTHDVDVVIELDVNRSADLCRAFPAPDFYCPPEEVLKIEAKRPSRGHANVIHFPTGLKADLYMVGQDALHRWAMPLRRKISFEAEEVWVAPPEYVIVRKLLFFREGGSEKHLRDIRSMLELSGAEINRAELEAKIASLGLQDLWAKLAP